MSIELLRLIWWLLLGVLLSGFALTDGFDFGAAFLMPLLAKNEIERQVVLNTIRPFWEGNQVWIILGAGAIFAAWPYVYAVAFSGPYFVMLLLLLTMGISRPVSFKYREKISNIYWRRAWDISVFIGGTLPPMIFGAVIGNLFLGLPFYFDQELRVYYTGHLVELISPFPLICAVGSLSMLVMHGGYYVAMKTVSPIRERARMAGQIAALIFLATFVFGGLQLSNMMGYHILGTINPNADSNPLVKQVVTQKGAWLINYFDYPILIVAPALACLSATLSILTAKVWESRSAFLCSAGVILSVITTLGITMFPFILPSYANPRSSLLIWDASSSGLTLLLMLVSVLIFMPIILLYTSWVYVALRGKVLPESIKEQTHYPPQNDG